MDFSSLAKLRQLETLEIEGFGLMQWFIELPEITTEFLEELTQLKVFRIGGMRLTNLSSFSQLTQLEELSLYGVEVEETVLHSATGVRLVDFSPLRQLKQMKFLLLNEVPPCDLGFLRECDSLQTLLMLSVKAVDLAPLGQLDRLSDLSLHHVSEIGAADAGNGSEQDATGPQDLSFLAGMTGLEQLTLDGMEWEVAPPFKKLEKIRRLELLSVPLRDLTPIKKMKSLERLTLDDMRGLEEKIKELQEALPDCKVERLVMME